MPLTPTLPLAGLPTIARWGVLLAISLCFTAMLEWLRVPAALLLGPLAAGIVAQIGGGGVRIARLPLNFAQAVIGCLVARSFTPEVVASLHRQWPVFFGVVAAIVLASATLGWTMSRLGIMRGTTAVWGLLPGAAPVMMLMADAYGGDARLVAFMQYLRVVLVVVTASVVARLFAHTPSEAAHLVVWFPPLAMGSFAKLVLVVCISMFAVFVPRLPAGVFMVSMTMAVVLNLGGYGAVDLPPWFLAIGFAFLGWSTGLRFTREVLSAAARSLPQCVISILVLMLFCGRLAALLVRWLGIDPLTAFLATSPGGLDSIAIIAASTKVDTPFVMTLQTVRFLLILLVGPALSRFVAGLLGQQDEVEEHR